MKSLAFLIFVPVLIAEANCKRLSGSGHYSELVSHFKTSSCMELAQKLSRVHTLRFQTQRQSFNEDLGFLKGISFEKLRSLDLSGFHFSTLESLQIFSNLEKLNLSSTTLSNSQGLAQLERLKTLILYKAHLGSDFKFPPHLKELNLFKVRGLQDLKILNQTPELEKLSLAGGNFSDFSEVLPHLKKLKYLNLNGAHFGDDDLRALSSLKNLEILDLGSTSVSDISPLASLPILREVFLRGTQVNNLTPLKKVFSLVRLDLKNTPIYSLPKSLNNCPSVNAPLAVRLFCLRTI